MTFHERQLEGVIKGAYIAPGSSFVTEARDLALVSLEGFLGDRHYGFSRSAGPREDHYEKGTLIHNSRSWSAVSQEELDAIAANLNIPAVKPEWVGANVLIEGIPNLTKLPPMTHLVINPGTSEAIWLVVYAENLPCKHPGAVLATQYKDPTLTQRFSKAAMGLRGLVGWVDKGGCIAQGDRIVARFPSSLPEAYFNEL